MLNGVKHLYFCNTDVPPDFSQDHHDKTGLTIHQSMGTDLPKLLIL